MRRLHVLDYSGNIRRDRATAEEIRAFAERSTYAEQLAHVTLGDDGELVTTPLTEEERLTLVADLQADHVERLPMLLDASHRLVMANDIPGVMVSSSAFTIWVADAPWAEAIVRDWATKRGLLIEDESPPSGREDWIRTMRVGTGKYIGEIVRLQWPSVKLGDHAIAVEAMCVGMANAFKPAEIEEPF